MAETLVAYNLADAKPEHKIWRVALVGGPGTGKTWAATTFPNVTVLDFDNKLSQHYGKNIKVVPMWNKVWVKENLKTMWKDGINVSIRDATLKWLNENISKMGPDETLLFDSWTSYQIAVQQQQRAEPTKTKFGDVDTRKRWMDFGDNVKDILTLIKACPCNAVMTFHEARDTDDEGNIIDKYRPVMDGAMKTQLKFAFSDAYRQVRLEKNPKEGRTEDTFWWQISASKYYDPITSRFWKDKGGIKKTISDVDFVPANYSSLIVNE